MNRIHLAPSTARARRLAVLVVVSLGALGLVATPAQATAPPMQDLGTLGGTYASATAVSGDIVVGSAYTDGEAGLHAFAFDLTSDHTLHDLGTLGGTQSLATGVSGDMVVGYSYTQGDITQRAFAFDLSTGTMHDLGTLGGTQSFATGVSGDIVVGYASTDGDAGVDAFAFDLSTDTMHDLGTLGGTFSLALAVSDDIVVGYAYTAGNATEHAFAFDLSTDTMHDLGTLGGSYAFATAVSGDIVVGYSYRSGNAPVHAFAFDLSTDSTMQDLGTLGGTQSVASAVSGDIVVGYASTDAEAQRAFAYDLSTDTMQDLGALGGTYSAALAMSGDIVVGYANTDGDVGSHAFAFDLSNDTTMRDLGTLGGSQSQALAVSGDIVVGSANTDGDVVSHAFAIDLGASLGPDDLDADGIADSVDPDPSHASAGFSDAIDGHPTTSGSVVSTPEGFAVQIEDAADPLGVRIRVTGAGSGTVSLLVCGSFSLQLTAGSDVIVTCGSVTVTVAAGTATISLSGDTTVTIPAGVSAKVSASGGGTFLLSDVTGGSVTVTTEGVSRLVSANATLSAWDFIGFGAPVDGDGVLNQIKAGRAVPLRWRIVDASGSPVTNLATATVRVASLACSLQTTVDQIEELAPGSSGLKNLGNGYYQLNWQTPTAYAGSCKTMKLDLGEGITRDALFQFTR